MIIKRYEHCCLDIVDGKVRLLIDPGVFSSSFDDYHGVSALVITHIHPDHFDKAKVEKLIESNPDIQVFTTNEVAQEIGAEKVTVPERNKPYTLGSMTLEFFGDKHGVLDPNNVPQNIGVLVNNSFYYPGDSLTTCNTSFHTLAQTTAAPWLTTSDIASFLEKCDCKEVFPVHDGLLNDAGSGLYKTILGGYAKAASKKFLDIKPGDSLEVS